MRSPLVRLAFGLAALVGGDALAQHSLSRTLTVDPSGSADYTTIQGAVNAISQTTPAVRYTVLIYAGTYAEAVTLGSGKHHVDLVGVDRDSVIIAPPADADGITIQGNGDRSNTIRNLTIVAPDDDTVDEGRGIVVKDDGGAAPSDIRIIGVRIETAGDASPAIDFEDAASDVEIRDVFIRTTGGNSSPIDGEPASDVRVLNCDVSTDDGRMKPGDDWLIAWSFLETRDSGGGGTALDDTAPITVGAHDNLIVEHCTLRGRGGGMEINSGADNVLVSNCDIEGAHFGAAIRCATNVRFENCRIASSSDLGQQGISSPEYVGVLIKEVSCSAQSGIVFSECVISASSDRSNRDAIGIHIENAPDDGPAQFLDCTIAAEVTSNGDRAFGVIGAEAESAALVGGSINAIDADERQTTLYDVYSESTAEVRVRTSGVEFSRWKGAIGAAVGQKVEVLRVVDIPSAGAATVLAATGLQVGEREITTNITQPEVYRVLSATTNDANLTGRSVIVIGRDWANRPIADSFAFDGTSATVLGTKAFRSVTKIVLPAKTADNQTVSVGTTEILGLHAPVSDAEDVLQVATKTSAGNSYVIESESGALSVERGTVDISSLSPADDDSIEFTYRASK